VDPCSLAKRRNWRADDAFRKALLVYVGNVENLETAWAVRGVKIFAAQDDVLNIGTRRR